MEQILTKAALAVIVLLLIAFSYGAVRLNLNRGNGGFPVTRRRRGKK